MPKKRTAEERSIDHASQQLLIRADQLGLDTAFARAENLAACPIGAGQSGICCKNCFMGPCRLTKDGQTGVCGATVSTIAARNLARAIAAGSAAHSDHGRDVAFTLLAAAEGEAQGYQVRDPIKLRAVAAYYGVPVEGKTTAQLAKDVAQKAIAEFGQQRGELAFIKRAPKKRQEAWRRYGVVPRGIDREVVDILHRTHMGDDQDAEHILKGALRCALADGWGGSMIATELSDVLFGTPSPKVGQVNLGVLKKDEVNIVLHGHEPTLSEMIVAAASEPELIEYAQSKGAAGINLAGICCTSNEILLRQGVPSAGNFLNQELALVTGAVEAMVVDVQCIMQALPNLADHFHTKVITTSPKVKIDGSLHIEFDEHHALDIARQIVRTACDNYANRGEVVIPDDTQDIIPGFSHEYINYMLGGSYRASFRPLNDAIVSGRIRGVVADVGCNNPRVTQDKSHTWLVQEFLKNDVLVVQTGCGALASGKMGLVTGEAALKYAGPGLREVCEATGMPPVLHMGSCVDNTRVLTVLTQMAQETGLGEDISDIPAVGLAPEWMSEKALAIGAYAAASGAAVIFGIESPVAYSDEVTEILDKVWEKELGGKLIFVTNDDEMLAKSLEHIDKKRAALGLAPYEAARFGKSGDWRIQQLENLPVEARTEALYGGVAA
ncbi:MAG: anaerobic carbon-monoxide dehydrogenase catalytic subunit [Anaerolineales bacterium]|nr:anaerobic carbon-monoxide dehydrogenase catalytic subunit [Anaerolineales bacterium]